MWLLWLEVWYLNGFISCISGTYFNFFLQLRGSFANTDQAKQLQSVHVTFIVFLSFFYLFFLNLMWSLVACLYISCFWPLITVTSWAISPAEAIKEDSLHRLIPCDIRVFFFPFLELTTRVGIQSLQVASMTHIIAYNFRQWIKMVYITCQRLYMQCQGRSMGSLLGFKEHLIARLHSAFLIIMHL